MKPEQKFEEFVRQKLEGLQPPFRENDWDKFAAYQKLHTEVPFWRQFGKRIAYTAAAMTGAVLVFANVYQYKHNKELAHKVVTLEQQLAQKTRGNPDDLPTRVDTVYIDRTTVIEATPFNQPKLSESAQYDQSLPQEISTPIEESNIETSNKNKTVVQSDIVYKQSNKIENQNLSEQANTTAAIGSNTVNNELATIKNRKAEKISNGNQAEDDIEVADNAGGKRRVSTVEDNKKGASKNTVGSNSNTGRVNAIALEKTMSLRENTLQEKIVDNSENRDIIAEDVPRTTTTYASWQGVEVDAIAHNATLSNLASIAPAKAEIKRYGHLHLPTHSTANMVATENKSVKKSSTLPPISLKNLKFRIGGGINIGDKYISYSANSSLLLGKYWSLDAGLKKTQITGPHFFTEANFKEKVQKEFQEWRKDKHPTRPPLAIPQILNIQTQVSLVQIPLSLTYRWGLRDGFTVMLSGGTHLNLSTTQQYTYKYREPNGNFEEESGNFDITSTVPNDVTIAAGVEKQWRNFVAQFETYASPYLKTPSYLAENRNLGVRFKLLYEFGKKSKL